METPEISHEDGMLPRFTGPHYCGLNDVLIVDVPNRFLKPGDPRFQLASNPLSEQKVISEFPATNILRSMLLEARGNSSDNSDLFPKNSGLEPNSSMMNEEDSMGINVREVPQDQIPQTLSRGTFHQKRSNQGRGKPSFPTATKRNYTADSNVQPWVNSDIAFCMQNNVPLQSPPTQILQHPPAQILQRPRPPAQILQRPRPPAQILQHPLPNPNHGMRQPHFNFPCRPARFSSRANSVSTRYPGRESYTKNRMHEPYSESPMHEPYSESHMHEPYSESRMHEPYPESRMHEPYTENNRQDAYNERPQKSHFNQTQNWNSSSWDSGFQNRRPYQNNFRGKRSRNYRPNQSNQPFRNHYE